MAGRLTGWSVRLYATLFRRAKRSRFRLSLVSIRRSGIGSIYSRSPFATFDVPVVSFLPNLRPSDRRDLFVSLCNRLSFFLLTPLFFFLINPNHDGKLKEGKILMKIFFPRFASRNPCSLVSRNLESPFPRIKPYLYIYLENILFSLFFFFTFPRSILSILKIKILREINIIVTGY